MIKQIQLMGLIIEYSYAKRIHYRIFFYVTFLFFLISCNVDSKRKNTESAIKEMSVADTLKNTSKYQQTIECKFGTVRKSETPVVKIFYHIHNGIPYNIVIKDVEAKCGCLTIDYEKEILTDKNGTIVINIDLEKQIGVFSKEVYVKYIINNSPVYKIVRMHGNIKK